MTDNIMVGESPTITIRTVDRILADAGLPTYTQRCEQLCKLAGVAIRDTGELEAEIHRLEELVALMRGRGGQEATMAESYKRRSARGWRR